eukprot:g20633.t1
MVCDWKVLSFVTNRAQVLYKAVSEPPLSLTNVKETTSGAADAIDNISGCAGEPLTDVKGVFGSLDRGERGGKGCEGKGAGNARDAFESIFDQRRREVAVLEIGGHLGCSGVERPILGANAVEAEELGIGDGILAGRWVRG